MNFSLRKITRMHIAGTLLAIACVALTVLVVNTERRNRIQTVHGSNDIASGHPGVGTRTGRSGDGQLKGETHGIGKEALNILHLLEHDFTGTIKSMYDAKGQVNRKDFAVALAEYFRWQNDPVARMQNLDILQRQWVLDEYCQFILPMANEIKDLRVFARFAAEFMSDQKVCELLANLPDRVLDRLRRDEHPFDAVADLFGQRRKAALAAVAEHLAEQRPAQVLELAQSEMIPLSSRARTRMATGFGRGDFAAGTAWLSTLPADRECRELAERMSRTAMDRGSLTASKIIASYSTKGPSRDGLIEGLTNYMVTAGELDGVEGWINEISDEQLAAKLRTSLERAARIRDFLQK